SVLQIFGDGST
ncbi:hypothetical protein D030_5150B, partial [Vibrio parahaemolyticus AQ3810]